MQLKCLYVPFSLVSFALVMFRQGNQMVKVWKRSCFSLKFLFWLPQTQLEIELRSLVWQTYHLRLYHLPSTFTLHDKSWTCNVSVIQKVSVKMSMWYVDYDMYKCECNLTTKQLYRSTASSFQKDISRRTGSSSMLLTSSSVTMIIAKATRGTQHM